MPTTLAPVSIAELKEVAKRLRADIVDMVFQAQSGHPGGSLSAVELGVALFWNHLRHDPGNPGWPDRDRFILSKGHATPFYYSVLAERGYFSRELLPKFRTLGSPLQGHPSMGSVPGVEMSSGSLGQGLSFAIGHALSGQLDRRDLLAADQLAQFDGSFFDEGIGHEFPCEWIRPAASGRRSCWCG